MIQAMKPNALPPLADRYCTAINGLLRRELHVYTTELKRSAAARMASSPPEPDIVKGTKKVQHRLHRPHTVLAACALIQRAWVLERRKCVLARLCISWHKVTRLNQLSMP